MEIANELTNFTIGGSADYSEEEHIVGTWINGKPVYQRTVILSTPIAAWANGWKNNVAFVAENIECLVDVIPYSSSMLNSGTEFISMGSNGYYSVYHPTNFNSSHSGASFFYTKTTD